MVSIGRSVASRRESGCAIDAAPLSALEELDALFRTALQEAWPAAPEP